jgi:cytochrome c-type biogenesis protein CcmH
MSWRNAVPRSSLFSLHVVFLALLLALGRTLAADAPPLSDAQETRYRALLQDLRCLVCQNESLLDSDAPLAADLRAQVRTRVVQGQSDSDIKRYLTDRYGDFVLYKPPLQANTWLLWGGPFLLVVVGLALLLAYARRTRRHASPRKVDDEALRRLLEDKK